MYVSFFLFFNASAFLKRLQILETFAVTFPIKYRGKRTGTKRKPSYICNGINHYCCHVDYDNMRVDFLKDIPNYIEL